jgi:MFS family permease
MTMPATLSIINDLFRDPGERSRAIGLWAGTSGVGIAIGPIAGGLLLAHFWWGSVLLVNVGCGATQPFLRGKLSEAVTQGPEYLPRKRRWRHPPLQRCCRLLNRKENHERRTGSTSNLCGNTSACAGAGAHLVLLGLSA